MADSAESTQHGPATSAVAPDKGASGERANADSVKPQISASGLRTISHEVIRLVPERMAQRFALIPVALEEGILTVAAADPSDVVAIDTIIINTGYAVKAVQANRDDVVEAIRRHYGEFVDVEQNMQVLLEVEVEEVADDDESEDLDTNDLRVRADDAPVVRYVNYLLAHAVDQRASDIHLEPGAEEVRVRFRVDGALRRVASAHKRMYSAIISRIKIMANMDIAERRLPQDGRCRVRMGKSELDIRVSTLPSAHGEKVVMRLLDKSNIVLGLEDLGFEGHELEAFRKALERPHGMILLTGPTGSGKTTSLYAGLNHINTIEKNIVTVEDPVEYQLPGITQTQVKTDIGLSFASALRTILRQDPDVVMVGEIRDCETVQMAVKAALTGHLVLSTLHTNGAISSVGRLENMGVEPYLIASSLSLVIAQRLVRRICKHCQEPVELPEHVARQFGVGSSDDPPTVYHGKGCAECGETGYRGRVAIYEVFTVSKAIRSLIERGEPMLEIQRIAEEEGTRSIRDAGWHKVTEGLTTYEDVLAATVDSA